MAIDPDSLLIFQARGKQKPSSPPGDTEQGQKEKESKGLRILGAKQQGMPKSPYANRSLEQIQPLAEKQNSGIDGAAGRTCVWHPWRAAYAICRYCKRPFCFEDTIEFNADYYCLEDIDKVSHASTRTTVQKSSNVSTIAGILLLASFLLFFFFTSSQIIQTLYYTSRVGLLYIMQQGQISYIVTLAETFAVLLCIMAALLVLMQTENSQRFAVATCFITVAVFSYVYTNSGSSYSLMVSILAFAAFSTLLYSTAQSISGGRLSNAGEMIENEAISWPNAGKF